VLVNTRHDDGSWLRAVEAFTPDWPFARAGKQSERGGRMDSVLLDQKRVSQERLDRVRLDRVRRSVMTVTLVLVGVAVAMITMGMIAFHPAP
jgi:hypothetical protein